MRKNSVYLSSPAIYTAIIENPEGVELFTKKLDQYENAKSWAIGMCSDEGHAFKITDSDTKRVLESGRRMGGEIVPYDVSVKEVKPIQIPFADSGLPKGVKVELEHRDLIVKMLTEAGHEATEEKIISIAAEIARVHEQEHPDYYEKLERAGL